MTTFEIYRWDSLISDNPLFPFPGIYIKPKPELLQYASQNNGILNVIIRGSDSVYDNKLLSGILSNSETFPNERKNFFKKTGYYIISLNSFFYQFPPKNGVVEVQNFFINNQPGNSGNGTNGNNNGSDGSSIMSNILNGINSDNSNGKCNNPNCNCVNCACGDNCMCDDITENTSSRSASRNVLALPMITNNKTINFGLYISIIALIIFILYMAFK